MIKRIAFFDSHLVDYKTLITQLQPGTETVVLDDKRDGIEQILIALQGKSNLAAIDIISHGSSGSITLGSGVLNISNLNSYENQLLQIGRHLAEDGDILLYGCKVAQGEIGLDFIEQLSQLTGSDVAASTSLTGAAEMGGNWLLEAQVGSIQAQAIRFDYKSVLVDDFSDTTATTGSVSIGGSISGTLEEPDDRDWFQVVLETGYVYEFKSSSDTIDLLNPVIHNPAGSPVSIAEESHSFSPTISGTHFFNIGSHLQSESGSYVISATKKNAFDDDDYSSTINTTGSVTIGGSTSGIISKAINDPSIFVEDLDWFKVPLIAGQTYLFRETTDSQIKLKLYNRDGDFLERSTVLNAGEELSIVYTATETDTYYIETSSGNVRTNVIDPISYTLSATQIADEIVDDYSDTTTTTGSVAIGGSTSGNIETPSDSDWFQVSLIAGQNYEFQLNSGNIDSFLTLYDTNGNLIIEDDDGGGNTNSLITYTVTSTGTHYLEAKSFNSNETGDYTVSAIQSESDEIVLPDDYADTIATTGLLTIGGITSGIIEESRDNDWFQVSLEAGHTYTFQVTGEEITPFITLYDANGILLDSNVSVALGRRGGDLDNFTATNTGTYYLGVNDVDSFRTLPSSSVPLPGNGTGDYTVSVSEDNSSLLPADRIFNWAESIFPDLLPNHSESIDILGYYARIYDNGNAVGEQDEGLYFYDGDSITLVGTVDDYLSNVIDSGF